MSRSGFETTEINGLSKAHSHLLINAVVERLLVLLALSLAGGFAAEGEMAVGAPESMMSDKITTRKKTSGKRLSVFPYHTIHTTGRSR